MGTAKQLRDLQILNLVMRGMKLGRIAHHLGLHRNTIAKTLRQPETQQLLESMKKDLVEQATTHMLERHKMIDQAIEAKHAHKRARRQGHRPEDGYRPIAKYLAHQA
jgi:transposase